MVSTSGTIRRTANICLFDVMLRISFFIKANCPLFISFTLRFCMFPVNQRKIDFLQRKLFFWYMIHITTSLYDSFYNQWDVMLWGHLHIIDIISRNLQPSKIKTVTFLSLTVTSAGIPLATASIMDMIYICWSIHRVISRYSPIIPVLQHMIRMDSFRLFFEWDLSFLITKYQKCF